MSNKFDDKSEENEINSLLDLVLHLDSYLYKGEAGKENLKNKMTKLNLSRNSFDIINEIISSDLASYYFCYDEKIKEIRNNQGIMKAIKEIFNKEKQKGEDEIIIRKINPVGFNQLSLITSKIFSSSESEFFFLKNLIHSKISNIIKSCFEIEYNKTHEKIEKINNKNNKQKNKTNFILISHSCLLNAKLINEFIIKNKNLSLSNNLLKINNNKILNPANFQLLKNSSSRSEINIFDNSKIFNLYKNPKNTSFVNSSDFNARKNSSSSCDKSSNKILDFNTMNISKNKSNYFTKKNIPLLYKTKNNSDDKNIFLPIINTKDISYKGKIKLNGRQLPSFNSELLELINYNTKNNIKVKNEQTFLDECIKESYRSLIDITDDHKSKCFVDYSKSSIKNDKALSKNNDEAPKKEKIFFTGFEYRNIYKYNYNRRLIRNKKN